MAVRVLASALLSAVLMFFWGFIFWGLSGAATKLMSPLPATAQNDVAAVLRRDKVPSGMYVFPAPADASDASAVKEAEDLNREGPRFQLAHQLEGGEMMPPATLAAGFGHEFVLALLSAILLAMVAGSLPSYAGRVGYMLLLSLIASIWSNVGDVIWWHHSPRYCAGNMVYELVMGLLMALVTAALVRVPAAQRPPRPA